MEKIEDIVTHKFLLSGLSAAIIFGRAEKEISEIKQALAKIENKWGQHGRF